MALNVDLLSKLTKDNSLPLDVFREILKNKYGAGWSIAKNLGEDPNAVGTALSNLRAWGLVATEEMSSDPDGAIDGIYYPTTQGLSVWENMNLTA